MFSQYFLQGSYGIVKLAYNEQDKNHYVRFSCVTVKNMQLVCAGNESARQNQTDEEVCTISKATTTEKQGQHESYGRAGSIGAGAPRDRHTEEAQSSKCCQVGRGAQRSERQLLVHGCVSSLTFVTLTRSLRKC